MNSVAPRTMPSLRASPASQAGSPRGSEAKGTEQRDATLPRGRRKGAPRSTTGGAPRLPARCHREPHRERPEKELQGDSAPNGDGRLDEAFTPPPHDRDHEQKDGTDRSEVDRAARERERGSQRIATPVAQAEQPERAADRSETGQDPEQRRDPGAQRMQRCDE